MIKQRNFFVVGSVALALLSYCGKKKDDESSTTDSTPQAITGSNPLAAAYPSSLAVSVFPTSSVTSLTGTYNLAEDTKAKNEDAAKVLKGESTSCFPEAMTQEYKANSDETCYEFDQDMISGTMNGSKGTSDGKNSSGEACLPAFARAKTASVIKEVDRALALTQSGMCLAKKKGLSKELEKAGDYVDLVDAFKENDAKFTVTAARVTREADEDGFQKFKIQFSVTRKDNVPMDVTLYHTKKDTENTQYSGVMQLKTKLSAAEKKGEGVGLLASDKYRLMSIQYSRGKNADTGKPEIRYMLRNGIFDSTLVDNAFKNNNGSTGDQLDLNVGTASDGSYTGFSNANDAVMGITFVAFTGNPDTNEGKFSYWQNPGSNYSENARGMIASLALVDGVLKGCAYSGAVGSSPSNGFSIRQSIKDGKSLVPAGFFHPFFSGGTGPSTDASGKKYYTKTQGPSTATWYQVESFTSATELAAKFVTEQMSNIVTRQCYKQDTTNKKYLLDTDEMKNAGAKGYELKETEASKNIVDPPTPPKKPSEKV